MPHEESELPEVGSEWNHPQNDLDPYEYPVEVTDIYSDSIIVCRVTDDEFIENRVRSANETRECGGNVSKCGLAKFVTEENGEFVADPEFWVFNDFHDEFESAN